MADAYGQRAGAHRRGMAAAAVLYLHFGTRTRIGIVGAILAATGRCWHSSPLPTLRRAPTSTRWRARWRDTSTGCCCPDGSTTRFSIPKGLLSTLPAVATAMLGMLAGEFVRQPAERLSGNRKALWMALAAVAFTLAGIVWDLSFPINKKLWSSSFVCVVTGYSLGMFALFYWLIDVKGYRGWVLPFQVIGLNSITIYMAQRIVDFKGISAFFFGGLASKMPEAAAPIVASAGYLAVSWLFLYFLYRKRIFLKV